MAQTAIQIRQNDEFSSKLAKVVLKGDLNLLSEAELVEYNLRMCERLGLDPLTQPFEYLRLNGKLVLYAKKGCAEQLRKAHGISVDSVRTDRVEDVFVVTATARDRNGRTDSSVGAVAVGALKGDALANALMKAETKAKRRVTLSICGLGMLDESELETIPEIKKRMAPTCCNKCGEDLLPKEEKAGVCGNCSHAAKEAQQTEVLSQTLSAPDFIEQSVAHVEEVKAELVEKGSIRPANLISEKQGKFLWVQAKQAGMNEQQLRELVGRHGFEHSHEITKLAFDSILKEIKALAASQESIP